MWFSIMDFIKVLNKTIVRKDGCTVTSYSGADLEGAAATLTIATIK